MEERASNSAYHDDDDDDHHDHHLIPNNNDDDAQVSDKQRHKHDSMQIVPSDGRPHSTYIVQIPKDQIYRVPPPENAEIVERYRNPVQKTQGNYRCAYWFLSAIFVVAFLISVIVCVHKFTLSPKPPTFSIKSVLVKQPSTSSKKSSTPAFQVSLETTNPNNFNDLEYKEGSTSLMYKGKEIGKGKFPALNNEAARKSDAFNLDLTESSKGGLPKDLQHSDSKAHSTKKAKSVTMNLSMSIPVKMKSWLWSKTVVVSEKCDIELNSTGNDMKVESQKCDIQK